MAAAERKDRAGTNRKSLRERMGALRNLPPFLRQIWATSPRLAVASLSLRVVRADGEPLAGRTVRQALESGGLQPGPQRIYHLVDATGHVLASVANLVRPGSLVPEEMDAGHYRGLSVFSILPGPQPAMQMLDGLIRVARDIAGRNGATVQDEQGAVLDAERLTQLRRSVQAYADAGDHPP